MELLPQRERLDKDVTWARALDGAEYMPGLLGLNNMKHNDYANVVVQIFSRVCNAPDACSAKSRLAVQHALYIDAMYSSTASIPVSGTKLNAV